MPLSSLLWGVLYRASSAQWHLLQLGGFPLYISQISFVKFYSSKQVGSCCGGMRLDPGIYFAAGGFKSVLPRGEIWTVYYLQGLLVASTCTTNKSSRDSVEKDEEAACRHVLTLSNSPDP